MCRRPLIRLASLTLARVAPTWVGAETIVSPALQGGTNLICFVTNVSSATLTLASFDMVSAISGQIIVSNSSCPPRAPNAAVMAPWTGCFLTVSPQLLQLGAYCRARHTSAPGSLVGTLQVLNLNALGFFSVGNVAMTPIPLTVQP